MPLNAAARHAYALFRRMPFRRKANLRQSSNNTYRDRRYHVPVVRRFVYLTRSGAGRAGRPDRCIMYVTTGITATNYIIIITFLAHQHKACRQLKIKQEMTAAIMA